MRMEAFRLPARADCRYSGKLIDRSRAVRFTLDGHEYSGFAGDSVLSTVMASGTDTFGLLSNHPIALDENLHPPVAPASAATDPRSAAPMSRLPISEGMELVSLAASQSRAGIAARFSDAWRHLRGGRRSSLGLDPESVQPLPGPWQELEAELALKADMVVVGAGAGGMGAAREAIERGMSVILLDQMAEMGGDATFFGAEADEARPEERIRHLAAQLQSSEKFTFLPRTEVLSLSAGSMRAHQISTGHPCATGRVICLKAGKYVLAPGAKERLPLFPGNRLPGVIGARSAHRLAEQYGVWRGNSAVINTSSSAATQVGLQAADLDVEITKLTDTRPDPQSRFFEFAKAYGISLATNVRVSRVSTTEESKVEVLLTSAFDWGTPEITKLVVDRMIVCGGWQADLTLWHMAGGSALWDADEQKLRATGELENVALAGTCADAGNFSECIESGSAAVRKLAGKRFEISGWAPNAEGESRDGELSISQPQEEAAPCFLDKGYAFSMLRARQPRWNIGRIFGQADDEGDFETRALGLNEVAAKVLLGEIPADQAAAFAKERCVVPAEMRRHDTDPVANNPDVPHGVPAWLKGRFGPVETVIRLATSDQRQVDTGCLLFANSTDLRIEQALGAVLSSTEAGVDGYVNASAVAGKKRLVAREGNRTIDLEVIADNVRKL